MSECGGRLGGGGGSGEEDSAHTLEKRSKRVNLSEQMKPGLGWLVAVYLTSSKLRFFERNTRHQMDKKSDLLFTTHVIFFGEESIRMKLNEPERL